MRRSQFDYHSYRGRKTASFWLKWIALVLAILVVLAVAFLLWGQQYISYTDNGLRVNFPFSNHESKDPDVGNLDVIDQEPGDGSGDTSDQGDTSQEQQPQEKTSSKAVNASLSSILDGSAAQLVQEQEADSVVVDMKNDQGQLGWKSQQSLASAVQSEAQDDQVNEKLKSWNEGNVYTVARMSCFRDEAVGGQMAYTLQTTSGYRWKDGDGMHWSDPSNQKVQDYLIGLMTELAQMGFDEIVLDHCGYPTQADGLLSNIQYGSQQVSQVMDDFLAKAAKALEPYGTTLSLEVSQEQIGGQDSNSGLTAQNINQYGQRLWISGEEQAVLSALTGAGVENPQQKLVLYVQQFGSSSTASQALLS